MIVASVYCHVLAPHSRGVELGFVPDLADARNLAWAAGAVPRLDLRMVVDGQLAGVYAIGGSYLMSLTEA